MQSDKKMKVSGVIAFGLIACIFYGFGAGIRSNIGILLNPLASHSGLHYDSVSVCIAFMQLFFGASQPVFGVIASRKSNRFVLLLGTLLLGLSMVGMMVSTSWVMLFLSLGVLFGLGAGAISFGLVLSSAIHFVGQDNAMIVSGMLNAAAGMIGFILSPLMQTLIGRYGLNGTLVVLILIVVALIPVAFVVTSHDREPQHQTQDQRMTEEKSGEEKIQIRELTRKAFSNRTYRLLLAGFSTCGFHMVIIESHLFSQFVLFGIDKARASWAFSAYGIATILGALLSGFLSTKLDKGKLLGFYYGFRAIWVLIYIFTIPKNILTAIIFSIGLGMTGDATVSPTSGLVSENFSIHEVATLIGVLFFGHQIGAFLSAWLGGIIRTATGGYRLLWVIDILVCAFASGMSLAIGGRKGTDRKGRRDA